jgi:hypothetical protein
MDPRAFHPLTHATGSGGGNRLANSGERLSMGRKIARTICAIVMFGVLLLCQVHAAIQLITGEPLDMGDWIGIISFGLIVLMAVSHLKCLRRKTAPTK